MISFAPPVAPITRYPDRKPTPPYQSGGETYPVRYFYVNVDGSQEVWDNVGFKLAAWQWRALTPYEAVDGREITVGGFTFRYRVPRLKDYIPSGWNLTPEEQERIIREVATLAASGEPMYYPLPSLPEFIYGANQHAFINKDSLTDTNREEYFLSFISASYRMEAERIVDGRFDGTSFIDVIGGESYIVDPQFELIAWLDGENLINWEKIQGVAGHKRFWILFYDPNKEEAVVLNVPHIHQSNWRDHIKEVGRNRWTYIIAGAVLTIISFGTLAPVVALAIAVTSAVVQKAGSAATQRGVIEERRDELEEILQQQEFPTRLQAEANAISEAQAQANEQNLIDERISSALGGQTTLIVIVAVGGLLLLAGTFLLLRR